MMYIFQKENHFILVSRWQMCGGYQRENEVDEHCMQFYSKNKFLLNNGNAAIMNMQFYQRSRTWHFPSTLQFLILQRNHML